MKTISIFIIIIAAAIIAFFVFWKGVPAKLSNMMTKELGVKVTIGSMGLSPASITINDTVIGNPPGSILQKAFSCDKIAVDDLFHAVF